MDFQLQLAAVAAILVVSALGLYATSAISARKLPPGPRGIPILGNSLQVPSGHLATYFRTLCEQYGNFVSLKLLRSTIIIIGDADLAKELLDKRSSKYSGRPVELYTRKYIDPDENYWALIDPGATWRIGRKLSTQIMNTIRAGKSHTLHRFEAMLTLQHILETPDDWFQHADRFAASVVTSAMFGVPLVSSEDQTMKDIVLLNDELTRYVSIGGSIINIFPFLDALPGQTPWRKRAAEFRKKEEALYGKLIQEAIEGHNSGLDNWTQYFTGKENDHGDNRRLVTVLTMAAIHTSATSLQIFVLACMCYPDWIKTAQAHLDAFVGPSRLPNFSDRDQVPYIEAVCREVLRWCPPARISVPHKTTEDDVVEYNGQEYYIPKGTTVIGLPWAIEHDPSTYPDPDSFKPERWLDENGQLLKDYNTTAFGWGRRVCVGVPFAERSIWINVAMWLWAFNIRRSPGYQYTSDDSVFARGIVMAPKPFPAVFEPRSEQHVKVVRQEWQAADKELSVLLPIVNQS